MSGGERLAAARRRISRPLETQRAEPAGTLRTLNRPRAARVRVGDDGAPSSVDGATVEAMRETWLLEDAWWTEHPLRRRYWEVVLADGASVVVFHDLCTGRWFAQAG
ncbi:MAG: hypothetical protein ACYCUM_00550 [Solirubrobacteraceae bacterium]